MQESEEEERKKKEMHFNMQILLSISKPLIKADVMAAVSIHR